MLYNKKGQSATEYLMTYGWAILAIAIVGALLYTQVFSQRACAVEGAAGFQLIDAVVVDANEFSVTAGGDLKIAVKNQVGKNITVTGITLEGVDKYTGTDIVIADGSAATLNQTGFTSAGTVGKCYSLKVGFVYNTSNAIDLRNSGTLNGRYG